MRTEIAHPYRFKWTFSQLVMLSRANCAPNFNIGVHSSAVVLRHTFGYNMCEGYFNPSMQLCKNNVFRVSIQMHMMHM